MLHKLVKIHDTRSPTPFLGIVLPKDVLGRHLGLSLPVSASRDDQRQKFSHATNHPLKLPLPSTYPCLHPSTSEAQPARRRLRLLQRAAAAHLEVAHRIKGPYLQPFSLSLQFYKQVLWCIETTAGGKQPPQNTQTRIWQRSCPLLLVPVVIWLAQH